MAGLHEYHVAIIECGYLPPDATTSYKGYAGLYRALFRSAVQSLRNNSDNHPSGSLNLSFDFDPASKTTDADPTIRFRTSVWDAPRGQLPDLETVDALWVSGSAFSAGSDEPWTLALVDLVKRALQSSATETRKSPIRLLGFCFGHQIIGRALGSTVGRNPAGLELSAFNTTLTEAGKEVFGPPPGRADNTNITLFQIHWDIVYELPADTILLASTERCLVHSFVLPNRAITVQGHPEFTVPVLEEIITTRREKGVLSHEVADDGLARLDIPVDDIHVASRMLRFMVEGWS